MDVSNCNLLYPKLRARPSYGEAMRYHAEFREGQPAIDDIENYPENFHKYISEGLMEARVEWGASNSSHFKLLSEYIIWACVSDERDNVGEQAIQPVAELKVHRIGCRPAMALLASSTSEIKFDLSTKECSFTEMRLSWVDSIKEKSIGNPGYLVALNIFFGDKKKVLQRTLHVVPPPVGHLPFRLQDVVWPLFENDEVKSAGVIRSVFRKCFRDNKISDVDLPQRQRRGFGLELETVQMPLVESNFEAGCFTQQQLYESAVNRARKWHLSNVSNDSDEDHPLTIESINSMWDELLLWSVSHDLYGENAAPPSRIDLFQRIRMHVVNAGNESRLSSCEKADMLRTLDHLVLGGKQMPAELLCLTPYDKVPSSQSSPEYKSPLPPHELYHEFPPPQDGRDQADASIRLFLDGVLKNPLVSTKPVAVPLVSDLGQSATSIHVHVNVANTNAWPRQAIDRMNDLERTQSLLCVIFGWVCFDQVVENNFCMPNVWRDRSFAPMLPTGMEFVWRDLSWDQGKSVASVDDDGNVKDANVYNLPAWFRHVHSSCTSFYCQEEKKESNSLFETVFDHTILTNTLSRWNSLNLLPINSYGTVEFRCMHASLNADFVSAWTWFCVGFVEKFRSPVMWDKFLFPFLKPGVSWKMALEQLAEAQNNATIEDLVEIMSHGSEPVLPSNVLRVLIRET